MLFAAQQLRHIFDDENIRLRASHDLKKRAPHLAPGIAISVLVEKAKALTRWTTDHYVRLRYERLRVFKKIDNIAMHTMRSEVGIVCIYSISIEIISPNGFKTTKELTACKAEGHAPGASEEVNNLKAPAHFFLTSPICERIRSSFTVLQGERLTIVSPGQVSDCPQPRAHQEAS
ncbi:hypothetical protein D3C86_1537010 [compost metagenome]